jgi:hypothetical protein
VSNEHELIAKMNKKDDFGIKEQDNLKRKNDDNVCLKYVPLPSDRSIPQTISSKNHSRQSRGS